MRAVLGLVRPRAGRVLVGGRPGAPGSRAVGYMPQLRGAADLRWTGWDFVASAAGGHRWGLPRLSPAERDEVAWALDTVGAADLARRPLGELSGGERQRLLLRQALLGRPKLLLLDEPLISPRPRAPARRGGTGRAARARTRARRALLRPRAQPADGRHRPRALRRPRPRRAGHGGRGHHRAGAVAPLRLADRGAAHRPAHLRHGGRQRGRGRGAPPRARARRGGHGHAGL